MITKGIRGAITVETNSSEAIEIATLELLEALIEENKIDPKMISHVIFTLTKDLNAAFPAKFARKNQTKNLLWDEVAMLCACEIEVPNSLEKCLRVLIVLNCNEAFVPKHIYLKGAKILRSDV